MNQIRQLKIYFDLFFLIGENAYVAFNRTNRKIPVVLSYLPRVLNFIFSVVFSVIILKTTMFYPNFLFVFILIIPSIFPNFSSLYGSFSQSNFSEKILISFDKIIDCLQMTLGHDFEFQIFLKRFGRKFKFSLAFQILLIVTKCSVRQSIFTTLFVDISIGIMLLYKLFSILHVTIFISLIEFVFQTLNDKLVSTYSDKNCFVTMRWNEGRNNLRLLKSVHFSCWNITTKINKRFGWFLAIGILESFASTVYALFWGFLYFQSSHGGNVLAVLRKYKTFLLIFA